MTDMALLVGTHDIAMVTLDTLRYDVAAEQAVSGGTPNLVRLLPNGQWQERHSPGNFTYAAHHAFFAGFLPTPTGPGPHPRLFAARFPGSVSTAEGTWVFDAPDLVTGLAAVGYHTLCLGGVGFFNRQSALGSVLPGLFAEAHWEPSFGVTEIDSMRHQLDQLERSVEACDPRRPMFTFLNVSALHQPNWHYLADVDAAVAGGDSAPWAADPDRRDSLASHAAALRYVDRFVPRLVELLTRRGRACVLILCSDHGSAYGEDGHIGHRVGHPVVWTVPYAETILEPGLAEAPGSAEMPGLAETPGGA